MLRRSWGLDGNWPIPGSRQSISGDLKTKSLACEGSKGLLVPVQWKEVGLGPCQLPAKASEVLTVCVTHPRPHRNGLHSRPQ